MRCSFGALVVIPLLLTVGCKVDNEKVAATPEDAFRSIEAIKLPEPTAAISEQAYFAQMRATWKQREPLVLAFLKNYPDDLRTAPLINEYWQSLMSPDLTDVQCDEVVASISDQCSKIKNNSVQQNAAFWKTMVTAFKARNDSKKILDYALTFSESFPQDPRASHLIGFVAADKKVSTDTLTKAYKILASKYSNTQEGERAKAILPLLENVGKPFEIAFKDVRTNKSVNSNSLKGKVVIVDFWATWCPPCVAAMPHLKQVYSEYRAKGVEVIGVSMDKPEKEGGKEALLSFISTNQVPWPQYYTNGDPTIGQKYGVTLLPTVFIVDKKGIIRSVEGNRAMEETLNTLLAE